MLVMDGDTIPRLVICADCYIIGSALLLPLLRDFLSRHHKHQNILYF